MALFSGNYNYVADGANKALNRLVGWLESHGHARVRVYAPVTDTPAFAPQGTLVGVPSFGMPGRGEYRVGLPLGAKTKRDLAAFAPDLVHLSAPEWLGHSALAWAERHRVPVVASFHTRFDTYFRYYGLSWLAVPVRAGMRRFYRRTDRVLVPSPSVGRALVEDGVLRRPPGRWSRGVEADLFTPVRRSPEWRTAHGIADSDLAIGFVGRLVKEKGLDVFAGAVEAAQARGVSVCAVVVGEGPERAWVERRLPRAVVTGHLSGAELATAYASLDVFLNPSQTETFGNVTLEAMSSGVPCIVAEATGSVDLVEPGESGLVVSTQDPARWADAVEALRDPATRKAMGTRARKVAEGYSWDAVLGEVLAQYREVLERAGQRGAPASFAASPAD